MKAKELMIGDLVWYVDKPIKVEQNYGKSVRYSDGEYTHEIEQSYITPIPLTEEILKANGFKDIESSLMLNIKGNIYLTIKRCRDDYKLKVVKSMTANGEKNHTNSRRWRIPEIVYVHGLQHALRFCGLNDLADNFKLK